MVLAFSVGVSRIYLGVHFPSDVLGGWFIGVFLLATYLWAEPKVTYQLRTWPWHRKLILSIILPLALFAINVDEDSAQLTGVVLGLIAGVLVELRWVQFSASGPFRQRLLRFIIGASVLIVLWLGTSVIFPSGIETTALYLRFLRYTLVGAWASVGAPWMFVNTGLAPRESEVRE
jgi:undecaprenyl-diphosphatase